MRSELNGADDPAPAPQRRARAAGPAVRPARPNPRTTRSRIAKPLLTSLGTITMLVASSFVVLAVSSTGSANPLDWGRADPSAAVGRAQHCGNQGLGAIGCMLSAGFRPASAAAPAGSRPAAQPLYSVATIQDQMPATTSGSSQTAKTPSRGSSTGSARTGSEHAVKLPVNATTADVIAACQAAMKTAVPQGAAAVTEVEVECEDDLESRCPAARTPPSPGTAALHEMEIECEATPSPLPSPGFHDE